MLLTGQLFKPFSSIHRFSSQIQKLSASLIFIHYSLLSVQSHRVLLNSIFLIALILSLEPQMLNSRSILTLYSLGYANIVSICCYFRSLSNLWFLDWISFYCTLLSYFAWIMSNDIEKKNKNLFFFEIHENQWLSSTQKFWL